jgi:hypothetical protein
MTFAAAHYSGFGTKRARADATDVRSWWKLTYERSGGIRVLTHLGQEARRKAPRPEQFFWARRRDELIDKNAIFTGG